MPALTAEQLLTGIRSDLKSNLGGFRQAANDNNSQISKIVRDISRTFATQRADIASLEDSIEENTQETRQTAARIDGMISILQESVNIQMGMLSELRSMSYYIRLLAQDSGGSILGGGRGGFAERAVSMTGAAAAALLAGTAGEALLGGAGGGAPFQPGTGTGRGYPEGTTKQQVADYIKEAAAKRGIDPEIAVKVAGSEGLSTYSGDPDATGTPTSFGPFQLHYKGKGRFTDSGLGERFTATTRLDARDPTTWKQQVDFALDTAKKEGWSAWHGWKGDPRAGLDWRGSYQSSSNQTPASATVNQTSEQMSAPAAAPATDAQPVSSANQTTSYNAETETGITTVAQTSPGTDQNSGKKDAEKINTSNVPKNDIVALGHYLQDKLHLGVSEHPDFPPYSPGAHGKNSAHKEGKALDINIKGVGNEAADPVSAAKFNLLADELTKAGYNVLWRSKGHDNHIHVQLGTQGVKPGSFWKGGGNTSETPANANRTEKNQETSGAYSPSPQAIPVSGGEVSSPTYSQSSMGTNVNMMASMLSGFLPGGLGGIVSGIAPMLTEALSSIEAPNMLNQAAVQTQSNQEIAQERASMEPETPSASTGNPPQAIGYNNMGMPQHEFKNLEESDWPERFMFGLNQLLYGIGGIRFLS